MSLQFIRLVFCRIVLLPKLRPVSGVVLLTIVCVAFLPGCKKSGDRTGPGQSDFRRYGVEHGHVHYEYSGDARGVEELAFDHWGRREVRIANQEHLQDKDIQTIRMINMNIGADVYSIDFQKHQATHEVNREVDSLLHLDNADLPNSQKFCDAGLVEVGFTKIGKDSVIGYPVDVWHQPQGGLDIYLWKAILLARMIKQPTDDIRMIATSFDTVTPIDTNLFKLPPGIQLQEKHQ